MYITNSLSTTNGKFLNKKKETYHEMNKTPTHRQNPFSKRKKWYFTQK